MRPAARRLSMAINRTDGRNGVPFASPVAMIPRQSERWFSWTHYGVMVPGLPEPHRWFGVMAILGTTGTRCFDVDRRIRTTPRDTACVVSGTATAGAGALRTYSMREECELREDGTRLRFGPGDLVLEQEPGAVRVHRDGDVPVALELALTDKAATFSRIPGVYDHWSLLARYRGTVGERSVEGLCTWEYARGVGPHSLVPGRVLPRWTKAPISSFTYQVLNLDPETQLLLTVAGPRPGGHVHEGAWERGLRDFGAMHRDVRFTVHAHRAEQARAPDGRTMRLPRTWSWAARDLAGAEVCALRCEAGDDWVYGLGAGWVGSFEFEGGFRGRPVSGRAYVEFIEV